MLAWNSCKIPLSAAASSGRSDGMLTD